MRVSSVFLGLEAVSLIHALPATDSPVYFDLNDRADLGINHIVQRADPTGKVRWTLHKTCFEDKTGLKTLLMRDAATEAVEAAKKRAELARDQLNKWKVDCTGPLTGPENSAIKSQCQLLLGKGDFASKCDQAIKYYDAVTNIEGPVGKDTGYANSPEWAALADETHHLNFVVYCAPDVEYLEIKSNWYWYDHGLKRPLGKGEEESTLLVMMEEWKAGEFKDKTKVRHAITAHSLSISPRNDYDHKTEAIDRHKIAATITLHPLVVKDFVSQHKHGIVDDEVLEAWPEAGFNTKDSDTPKIEYLNGFQGLLLHEMFHTPGLGRLADGDLTPKNWGWKNMVRDKNMELPEFYMYLALVAELTAKKIKVNENGGLDNWDS